MTVCAPATDLRALTRRIVGRPGAGFGPGRLAAAAFAIAVALALFQLWTAAVPGHLRGAPLEHVVVDHGVAMRTSRTTMLRSAPAS